MNVTLRSEISFQSSKCVSVPQTFGTAFFIPQDNSVICLWHLVETEWVALRHSLKIESPISEGIKRRAGTRYPGLFAKQKLLQTKLCVLSEEELPVGKMCLMQ